MKKQLTIFDGDGNISKVLRQDYKTLKSLHHENLYKDIHDILCTSWSKRIKTTFNYLQWLTDFKQNNIKLFLDTNMLPEFDRFSDCNESKVSYA